ncbi:MULTISPECIES: polysaccharide deacetylase family protein [Clostridium]|uniref:Peptidoglycan/xylan/chitin deacetylase (PgdA/CDA1 family) n=3 Tax=Clostridium TaxID=1485 RepID=A0A1S8PHM4_CLOBE|nr:MULTISPECIES: polysaccharide deacetylase family protein [Clostridium]ALB48028.1 polysaccharide deacetylase [Clostridium beijerinckii NRRL B-598]AQS03261.1 peptidoglycan-N-acetylglucosamine deacetylase [Clostridium beijerinckii]AVK49720.1 polysaccharide deacetylase [Clostridium sp. MF28]MBA2886718.1 peptidoglycan/xylan/chitin deacetylase (PgdA/CDA1 family) [Clostridium beijerinckii]MBA2901452.1 peptidoglycan/xylan/chitin deacetylase (PgdA/CDA1 family) [Clostridium beijerinckii]
MNLKSLKKYIPFVLIIITIINYQNLLMHTVLADEKKIIYLTFDDGPAGKVTTNVLDILKQESVPATFFLIGSQIKGQEDLVKRMYNEGHALGLHSMSHNRNILYHSNEEFLKEMLDTQQIINSIVGIKPTILRFPFGCNNNCYKISQSMVDLLHQNNLKIYDWNTDSGDGAHPNASPSTFIKNSKSDKERVVLLMHCAYMSKNSVTALPSVIKYYKDNGYEFKAIDENTDEEYHFMKK